MRPSLDLHGVRHEEVDALVLHFINDHWEELETFDGISVDPVLSEHQLAKISDKMLSQLLSVIPDIEPNSGSLIRSRAFCEGYILAVIAGSKPDEAYNAGMSGWRQWYCPEANEAFNTTFHGIAWPKPAEHLYNTYEDYHADLKAWNQDNRQASKTAMSAFWTECRKRGLATPNRPPKSIKAIAKRGTGLILANGRFVTWRTAVMITNAEGFDLTPERKERLIQLLRQNKWAPQLIKALSS